MASTNNTPVLVCTTNDENDAIVETGQLWKHQRCREHQTSHSEENHLRWQQCKSRIDPVWWIYAYFYHPHCLSFSATIITVFFKMEKEALDFQRWKLLPEAAIPVVFHLAPFYHQYISTTQVTFLSDLMAAPSIINNAIRPFLQQHRRKGAKMLSGLNRQ